MKHRIYRLRDTLKHAGACRYFIDLCDRFETAEEMRQWCVENWLERVGSSREEEVPVQTHVCYFADQLLRGLGQPFLCREEDTPEKCLDTFKELWQRYADLHGLYEEEEVEHPPVGSVFYFYHMNPSFRDSLNGERCQVASMAGPGPWVWFECQRGLGLSLPEREMFMHRRGE